MIKSAPETGLVRFGYRDYDATSGRWLSKDPIDVLGGFNLYQFEGNDPGNSTDPFGLQANNPPSSVSASCCQGGLPRFRDAMGGMCCKEDTINVRLMNLTSGFPPHTVIVASSGSTCWNAGWGPSWHHWPAAPGLAYSVSTLQGYTVATSFDLCPSSVAFLGSVIAKHTRGWYNVANVPGAPNCTGWACHMFQAVGLPTPGGCSSGSLFLSPYSTP